MSQPSAWWQAAQSCWSLSPCGFCEETSTAVNNMNSTSTRDRFMVFHLVCLVLRYYWVEMNLSVTFPAFKTLNFVNYDFGIG